MKNRILIDESEKRRILGLHNTVKINEQATTAQSNERELPQQPGLLDDIIKKLVPGVQLSQEELKRMYETIVNFVPKIK
jgi:hypothetical protein